MKRLLAALFALMLVTAACAESSGSSDEDATTTVAATMADDHDEGDAHQEGDGHEEGDHDGGEAAHEEGDDHDEADHRPGESIPDAVGEVTSEYTVTLSEFAFDPDEFDLTPGETVRFTLINEGVIEHEWRLTAEHKVEEHIAAGHEGHGEEAEGGHHEGSDIIVLVAAGETRVVELTLPADADAIDVMACILPGHYEAGMAAPVDF